MAMLFKNATITHPQPPSVVANSFGIITVVQRFVTTRFHKISFRGTYRLMATVLPHELTLLNF